MELVGYAVDRAKPVVRWPRLAIIFACLLLLNPASAHASDSDVQLWPVVGVNHALTDRWGAHLQARMRFDDNVSNTRDFLVRPFISWRALESLTLCSKGCGAGVGNRLRAAIGTRLLGRLRVESGYEWQYAEGRIRSSVNRHVFVVELSLDTRSRP